MDIISALRKTIPWEEFDYQALLQALKDYACPRDKITDLLAKGVIVRVKKGLYIFGDAYRTHPYSREILANLIYGPSCVSLEYALHYRGLTPEGSAALTSVTTKRGKQFQTPVGLFFYRMIPEAGFHIGMQRVELEDGRAFLLAGPEKALADKLRCDRGLQLRSRRGCLEYLLDSLRIAPEDLSRLDLDLLERLAAADESPRVRTLVDSVRYLRRESA
ncbi:hypothetical protein [Malonomonas rubra]|uniref:type IV toxin-antitoxin system AbiEi family antitoxin domain-containing protein n=1 Tax=Malonomonas rubra TaxID=57040 RepID=UPI0026EE5D94|nr:hypothetical protein [Malonomonas rubra]